MRTAKIERNGSIPMVSLICIMVLFVLRIPMLGFFSNSYPDLTNVYMIGTYSFTALFI